MKMAFVAFVLAAAIRAAETVTTHQGLRPLLRDPRLQQQASLQQSPARAPSLEQEQHEQQASPPELGPDGFPTLPEVSKLLNVAQHTLQNLTAQATSLKLHVEQVQKEKTRKMSQQKAGFEATLQAQEVANRALVAQNNDIAQQIQTLRKGNSDVQAKAKQLERTNLGMRDELLSLEGRLSTAYDFAAQSLSSTDDSQAEDLRVLEDTHAVARAPRAQADTAIAQDAAAGEEDGDDEGDDANTSLLALRVQRRALKPGTAMSAAESNAHELIKELQQGVSSLDQQETASESQLRALFKSSFHAGAKRRVDLLGHQKDLNVTRTSLTVLQGRLRTAESHLQATRKHLRSELHDMGVYLHKLSYVALSPPSEAANLTKALPTSVAAPASSHPAQQVSR